MIDHEATTAYALQVANIHLVTMPDAIPTHPCSGLSHPPGSSLVLATVGKTLLGSLLSYTAMLGFSSFQEERSMPTFMFRLFLVDEIKLFFKAAPN